MIIDKKIITGFERNRRKAFSDNFKKYLLEKYSKEPFPYEYSEQDLYAHIEKDIRAYDSGKLNITIKNHSEKWQEEREYLQCLYIEKCRELNDLNEYVEKLEHVLLEHGLGHHIKAEYQPEF
ncbi:MAG: hypothetical protein WBI07_15620 [Mobilitalea sp.]